MAIEGNNGFRLSALVRHKTDEGINTLHCRTTHGNSQGIQDRSFGTIQDIWRQIVIACLNDHATKQSHFVLRVFLPQGSCFIHL